MKVDEPGGAVEPVQALTVSVMPSRTTNTQTAWRSLCTGALPDRDRHPKGLETGVAKDDRIVELGPHAALKEYKTVRATMPLPASPIDTCTGLECPGTVTSRTRIE